MPFSTALWINLPTVSSEIAGINLVSDSYLVLTLIMSGLLIDKIFDTFFVTGIASTENRFNALIMLILFWMTLFHAVFECIQGLPLRNSE